jgi:hypothetical protein
MSFLASLLAAIPAIEKLVVAIVKLLSEAEKKNQKDNFKKAVEKAILSGDQRELDSGSPSGHQGVSVVKRDKGL